MDKILGKFLIGGITVSGISYLSNNIKNTLLASMFATIPLAMPSSIFIDDNKVKSYSKHILLFDFFLLISTFQNWALLEYTKLNKYETVTLSMITYFILVYIYYIVMSKKKII
jgi:hypothetical protein